MIDFLRNLPEPVQDDKITNFHPRMTRIDTTKEEISEISNLTGIRVKLTLPETESHIIPEKQKQETQRTRRGESTSLF